MNLFSNLNPETELTMELWTWNHVKLIWMNYGLNSQTDSKAQIFWLAYLPSFFMNQNIYSLRSSIWNYLLTNWNEGCGALYIWNVNSVKNDRCFKKWWYTHTGTSEPRGARGEGVRLSPQVSSGIEAKSC